MNNKIRLIISSIIILAIGCSLLQADSPMDIRLSNDGTCVYVRPSGQVIEEIKRPEKTNNKAESPTDKEVSIEGTIKVNTSLRLREYPWGPVLGSYTNNTKCTIIGEEGEFYKVNINGKIGYLHKNYVSTDAKPASRIEPDYPGNCKSGGYIARTNNSSTTSSNSTISKSTTRSSTSSNSSAPLMSSGYNPALSTTNTSNIPVKESVIGQRQGDGTVAGALTWAKDQMAGGTKQGFNRNNNKISQNETCWNHWCCAFIASAWGRKIPQMSAKSAYEAYKNFKRDGMIHTDKNPPAGAIMFTAPTAKSKYGHVFMATGEVAANGEPMVITSGWTGHNGITTMTLSQMIGSKQYLGWALP